MKVVVTGARGQVGSALTGSCPAGIQLTALDRKTLDITDRAAVRETVSSIRPDIVINAAAYTAVDKAESEPDLARAVNSNAPHFLSEAITDFGGKMVQISTDFVFDGQSNSAYLPQDRRAPVSVYGSTKSDGEDAIGEAGLIVRTSWVYAAGHGNFVRTMLRLMQERDEVRVVADQIGAPTWAAGLAQTIWGLIGAKAQGVFHHCDAGTASWYDFAVAIKEEAQQIGLLSRDIPIIPITTAQYPTPARRPVFSLLDCNATHELLGDARPHWRENLRQMLKEERTLA
ncbi:MAG: dTDP-4-dehydrorhamnose reductase [Erythrobacter sp.]